MPDTKNAALPVSPPVARAWRSGVELLSSMRFAIALLTVICIASVVGTVLRQHEQHVNYVNQFGIFWTELFTTLQLHAVYSAWWFLLILAFLVISTSLCIARNAPKYLADMRRFREDIRVGSFRAMPLRAEGRLQGEPEALARQIGEALARAGWKVRLQKREGEASQRGWMVAAKAGAANRIGYIASHSAIVLICLGGLLDGDLLLRAQIWLGHKEPYTGGGLASAVPARHRLGVDNPSYRGNVIVGEGTQSGTAVLNLSGGVMLQELPFIIELKKFNVEYYSTGMPRLFASDIVIHDRTTGESSGHRVEVNHPVRVHGVDIFQASFDDGGSRVRLQAHGLTREISSPDIDGVIGGNAAVGPRQGLPPQQLEFVELRTLNVENLAQAMQGAPGAVDVRRVDLRSGIKALEARLGAGNKTVKGEDLRNVGPSLTYRLRDASGQAREFHNYMRPIELDDGLPVFMLGVRQSIADNFSYLRIPQDENGGMEGFLRLQRALHSPQLRAQAVDRYVKMAVDAQRPELQEQLRLSALRALNLFAGVEAVNGQSASGLVAISQFLQANVPAAEAARATEVLMRILNGVLFELLQLSRENAGLAPLPPDEAAQTFMRVAVFSLSDAFYYPEPVFFSLEDFEQVQASVFQVTRSPGRHVVYAGCFFLIAGVFMMLYVRERRLWVWLTQRNDGTHVSMALSANRKTLDTEREFTRIRNHLLGHDDPAPAGAAGEEP